MQFSIKNVPHDEFSTKNVPHDDVPFVLIDRLEYDCLFGRDKSEKERKKNEREIELQVNVFVCVF